MGRTNSSKAGKKKGLSATKKRNIKITKLKKKGIFGKEERKLKRKERQKEKKGSHAASIQKTRKQQENLEPETEITGDDMLDMMDQEDVDELMKVYGQKDEYVKQVEEELEDEGISVESDAKLEKKKRKRQKMKELLPILTEEGSWATRKIVEPERKPDLNRREVEEETEEDSGVHDDELSDSDDPGHLELSVGVSGHKKTVAQVLAERRRIIHRRKIRMACLALNISKEPSKTSNLRCLVQMMKENDPKTEIIVRRYVTITLLRVFHDLIPGFRVNEEMPNQRMKQTTLSVSQQEVNFLVYYRKYLKELENVLEDWKLSPDDRGLTILSELSLHCLGELLWMHPHFNYGVNIVQALMPYLNHGNPKMREVVLDAFTRVLKSDADYYMTVQVVNKLYSLLRSMDFKVKPEVIKVLLSLRVKGMKNQDSIEEDQRKTTQTLSRKDKLLLKLTENAKKKPSRKQNKEKKKMARIREQMADIKANEVHTMQNERHSEILQKVFGIYFHILKKKATSQLMPIALEGLAKFAHLINVEFFSDILEVMNKLVESGTLQNRECLHSIQTVFTILSGQGEALNIDPQRFYNQFYRILVDLRPRKRVENLDTILDTLEQMLISRRKRVSVAKVLSFAKRIATTSLTLPHDAAIPLLVSLKKLFMTFSATEALLDSDPDGSPGMFQPDIHDPEHSNATATAVWDLVLCQNHYHPTVQFLSRNILSGTPAMEVPAVHSLVKSSTDELLEKYDTSRLKFNPTTPYPATHLSKFKAPKRRLFQDGVLTLQDLKLQQAIDQIFSAEDRNEPPKKKTKLKDEEINDDLASLQFFESFHSERDGNLSETKSTQADNFALYFIEKNKSL